MKRITPLRALALAGATLALPASAFAHSGHALVYDCASGAAHPFHGWDHFAAMIAVGVWAAQMGGRARWLVPASFILVMTCAAALGARGFALPGVEPMIGASVLVLGVLIAATARLPLGASVVVVALFAAAHGFAHGAEIPAGANVLPYAMGFVLATTLLHAAGLSLGHLAQSRFAAIPRALGATCAVLGAALLLT